MNLSQSDIELIRSRQTGLKRTSRQVTVSNKRNIVDIATPYLPQKQQEQLQTVKNVVAAGAGNPIALGAGIVVGAGTGSPTAGATAVGTVSSFMKALDDEYEEGEDEYMRSLGYTGGAWSLSEGVGAIRGMFTGRTSQFSKDLQSYRRKRREMKRLRLKGSGDYRLMSNSLVSGGGVEMENAQIVPSGPRAIRIIYREYLGDVYTHPTSAGAFNIASYDINPGLVSTFPWLNPIAQQYEQWTPNGIAFEFKSTSSDYVSTQALGSVIMATEYDQLDSVFANKQEMLNSAYANEFKPSCDGVHGVECAREDRPLQILYVRAQTVPSTGDIRDYDCGRFSIATQGGATANLNLGSLYVHYDITLRKEQLFNGLPLQGQLWGIISGTGMQATYRFPVIGNQGCAWTPGSNTSLFSIDSTGLILTFGSYVNTGTYMIYTYFSSTAGSPTQPSVSYSNCQLAQGKVSTAFNAIEFDTATGLYKYRIFVEVLAAPARVTLTTGVVGSGTPNNCFVQVMNVNKNFGT